MKKFLTLSFVIFLAVAPAFSITLDDLELQGPKLPAYRVGLTDKPENPYVEVKQNVEKKIEKKEVKAENENVNSDLNKIHYDKTHRVNLSKQIVLQYMRTPLYRNTKADNELNAYCESIKYLLKVAGIFEVNEVEFKADNKADFHKTILLENIDSIINDIADADWELLYASLGEFYTSDNPVVVIVREDMPVTYCDAIKYFSEIYYPLNSRLTLHIKAQLPSLTKKINIRICDNTNLLDINKLIINNAVKYVIYKNQFN